MTEADWLKGKNPDAMLRKVAGRFSPRRWHLLACAHARRAVEVLDGQSLLALIDRVERRAGEPGASAEALALISGLEEAARAGVEAARAAERQIVLAADPDTDPDSFRPDDHEESGPAVPLFQAACRAAVSAINSAGDAVLSGHATVNSLLQLPPGPEQLEAVRRQGVETTRVRALASLSASSALRLKSLADEAADLDTGRSDRLRRAEAEAKLERETELAYQKQDDLLAQKQRADRKAFVRFLHDLVGNPFRPYRFEPAWRTDEVLGLARAIDRERAFDRMPILADALLDVDCDEEAVLRHCRGTEAHAPDGPAHGRGCWVIDLILQTEPEFFAAPPAAAPARRAAAPRKRPPADGWAQLFEAVRRLDGQGPGDRTE